jgi:uncharacterized protein (TIGR02271 family)
MDILDRDGAVDMDERESSWRTQGWTGYQADNAAPQTAAYAAVGSTPTAAAATAAAGAGRAAPTSANARAGIDVGREGEVVPVYEERLKVGKRDVSHGRVRLRSYVVETPVQEQVALRSERGEIERRPVDRAVTSADVVFQDRTIELEEFAEEAVVSKDVRVVEEVGLRKVAQDRTETVADKVRRTEVDIEDGRTTGGATGDLGRFAAQIRNDMEVVGSDGMHVGTIDHQDGDRIKLKKIDAAADGEHRYLTQDLIGSVADKVVLAVAAAEARNRWTKA